MSQWAEIRHMHEVQGVAKREVARRFGLDVKTVRRAIAREEAPLVRRSPRRGQMLDPWRERIEQLLEEEPKISAKRIARILEPETGGLSERTVRRYVADVRGRRTPPEAFVHRTAVCGDAMEVDFGESWAEIAERRQKVKYIVATLPASNSYFAKAYPLERLECLMDGISEAFEWFGGLPKRAILDNTSLAVKEVLKGADRIETQRFHAFRGEWVLHVDYCAPGKGWEKGSIERGVEYVRGLVFRPTPKAASFDELNRRLLEELDCDLDRRKLRDGRTARAALQAEREHLRPLPARRPETCRVLTCIADKYAYIRVDRVTYSLPTEHARRTVTVKLYHDRVEAGVRDEIVAKHERSFTPGTFVIDPQHVLPLLEKKHRAVGEATAIVQWELPAVFHELREKLRESVRKPDREWVQVLRLMRDHPLDDVERAVNEALARSSARLQTIEMLLRQDAADEVHPTPLDVECEDLAALRVAEPDLASWDLVCEGVER